MTDSPLVLLIWECFEMDGGEGGYIGCNNHAFLVINGADSVLRICSMRHCIIGPLDLSGSRQCRLSKGREPVTKARPHIP